MVRFNQASQDGHFLSPQWSEECRQVSYHDLGTGNAELRSDGLTSTHENQKIIVQSPTDAAKTRDESGVQPHLAVPHGDMMLTGNFGLLRAYAAHDPHVRDAVERRLGPG